MSEHEIRQTYRVISDPSWQVQHHMKEEWVTVYYCSDEAGAGRCLERCIKRAIQWQGMSEEEKMSSILR